MSTRPPKRLSLKDFQEEYINHKEEENTSKLKRKRKALEFIYDSYAQDYQDPYYIHDKMMDAIDNGLTEVPVFYEEEDEDIALWDNDIEALFEYGNNGRPALGSYLSDQLSDEFRFHSIKTQTVDRDDVKYNSIEISIRWGVQEDDEKDRRNKKMRHSK